MSEASARPERALPRSLYQFIWQVSRARQIQLCLLAAIVIPLSMVPLELQRRMLDDAIKGEDYELLLILAGLYLGILAIQGGLKYLLNVGRGAVIEEATRVIREIVHGMACALKPPPKAVKKAANGERGAIVSIMAAEAEDVGGFVGESISVPLVQGGTVMVVLGYLLWIEPMIAGFSILLYLPQAIIVPRVQHAIKRYVQRHARQVRTLGREIVATVEDDGDSATRFRRTARAALGTRMSIYRRKYFLTLLGNFLDAMGPLTVLFVGGWLVIEGEAEISTIVVFISGLQRIAGPWDDLVTFYRSASNAFAKYALLVQALPKS